jgi:pyruvate/2-oxoglutarate dehydrogenase complex dihydrolipoamide acyltransferase (E2) component
MARFALVIPDLGDALKVVCIATWQVAVGDWLEKDAVALSLTTDKADIEVPTPFAGRVVQLLYPVGTTLRCGEVVAILESER